MAGKKGKSGRKELPKEQRKKEVRLWMLITDIEKAGGTEENPQGAAPQLIKIISEGLK